ncbi:hypothetical protein HYFRA_00004716 [Hymenoscyphus fraxineus]|uniref:Uncharacterized protein n=1 Tax=Hymenoscyphus fraxineus TaxID=746836 RepID=A0A9N9KVX7_9HELO|nr:hypothetical protein HYFRA_00004716 [Hymenoscyphus fraxineus]
MTTTFSPETNLGITTSWLPLTTSWIPPTGCGRSNVGDDEDAEPLFDYDSFKDLNYISCQAREIGIWWSKVTPYLLDSNTISGKNVWSVGPFQCPLSYTVAATTTVKPGIIDIACCPSNVIFTATRDMTISALHVNGRNFVSIPPSTSLPIPLATSFPQPFTTQPVPLSAPPKHLLTKSKIIGISFAVIIPILLFLALGVWIFRKRQSQRTSRDVDDLPRALGYRNELPGDDQRFEIDGRLKVSELGEKQAHELCVVETAVELPADFTWGDLAGKEVVSQKGDLEKLKEGEKSNK